MSAVESGQNTILWNSLDPVALKATDATSRELAIQAALHIFTENSSQSSSNLSSSDLPNSIILAPKTETPGYSLWNLMPRIPFFGAAAKADKCEHPLNPSYADQGIVFSHLCEKIDNHRDAVYPMLCDLFGQNLVDKTLSRVDLRMIQPAAAQLHVLLAAISANAGLKDIQDLHQKIARKDPKAMLIADYLPSHFAILNRASAKSFEELNSREINALFDVFRSQFFADGTKKLIKIDREFLKDCNLESLSSAQKQEMSRINELVEVVEKSDLFQREHFELHAEDEFFARVAAYAHLEEGMVVSYTKSEISNPVHYEVKKSIDRDGFGFFILKPLGKDKQKPMKILFRGTDFSDLASARACLSPAAGLEAYNKNRAEIWRSLSDQISGETNVKIEIAGHSQGASISQFFVCDLAALLAKETLEFPALNNITHAGMSAWNPPAILETQADELKESVAILSDRQHDCKFQLRYLKVSTDIVHQVGEVYAGYGISSSNVEIDLLKFAPTDPRPLMFGPHRNYILTKDRESVYPLKYLSSKWTPSEELQKNLSDTTFKRLTPTSQKVSAFVLEALKDGLAVVTDRDASLAQRAGVVALGAGAAAAAGAAVMAAPLSWLTMGVSAAAIGAFGYYYAGETLLGESILLS